jgi:hypothetical protein
MTEILGKLQWEKSGDEHVILLSPIEYRLNSGKILIAEKGFRYDGKSGAKVFDAVIPPFGSRGDHAFCFHDRGYYGHRVLEETNFTREEVDDGMLEILLYLKVNEVKARAVWSVVRAGGEASWMNPVEQLAMADDGDQEFRDG